VTDSKDKHPTISPADAMALDHLAADGFDADRATSLEGKERARCDAAVSLLSLLDSYPTDPLTDEDEQTLIDATMARIRRAEDDRRDRMGMDNQRVMLGRGLRFRIAEALAVAAVVAMATAAIWSFGTASGPSGLSASTHRHLGDLHAGLSGFKDANNGAHPLTEASRPVARLLGNRDVHLLNLYMVAAQGHFDAERLKNPRRPAAGRHGFSYATLPLAQRPFLNDARVILVGDRNPALVGLLEGKTYAAAMAASSVSSRLTDRPSVLFADGHVEDLKEASNNGDCVWSIDPTINPAPIEIFLAH
jgi:prepilin-type processing-associated H-X9-DG protein